VQGLLPALFISAKHVACLEGQTNLLPESCTAVPLGRLTLTLTLTLTLALALTLTLTLALTLTLTRCPRTSWPSCSSSLCASVWSG
jgi:hypothetical protein